MCAGQCVAILKTGPNKGNQCGNYSTKGKDLCGIHQRSARKNQVVPLPAMYVVTGVPVEQQSQHDEDVPERKGLRRWMCM